MLKKVQKLELISFQIMKKNVFLMIDSLEGWVVIYKKEAFLLEKQVLHVKTFTLKFSAVENILHSHFISCYIDALTN